MSRQLALDVEPPLVFVPTRPDGTPICSIPVDGSWHEAACWARIAFDADRRENPEAWPAP